MRKIISILSLCCLSAAMVFAAGGEGERGAAVDKTLNRYVIAKIQPFDPADMTDLYTHLVYGEIGEALFAYEYLADSYVLRPGVAKEMPTVSSDGLVYTIEMQNDVYYYDPLMEVFPEGKGRAVMAKDFVLSIKRLADPATESGGWWLYEGYIKGLVLQDPINMGYLGIKTIIAHLQGQTVEKRIDTGSVVATPENMDDPKIKNMLEPDFRKWLNE